MRTAGAVTIRRGSAADAGSIAKVHVRSWQHAYRGQLPDAYLDRLSADDRADRWLSSIAEADDRSGVLVAEVDGPVVGFASFGPSRDADAGESVGEIPAIYLEPDAVGRGIGRQLFEAAAEELRRARFVRATLWVLEVNERARRFYEAAGWAWDGTVSRHDFDCANEPMLRYAADL